MVVNDILSFFYTYDYFSWFFKDLTKKKIICAVIDICIR